MQYKISVLEDWNLIIQDVLKLCNKNVFLLLEGDLGAGKTTFVKMLLKKMGVSKEITSPTFNIINNYTVGNLEINHMDAYRLDKNEEISLYEEMFEDALNIIEWPFNINYNYNVNDNVYLINIEIKNKLRNVSITKY